MVRSIALVLLIFIVACSDQGVSTSEEATLFTEMEVVKFENKVVSTDQLDVFRYRNFYNGGGVSIGDINGDTLPDIYLTSNLDSNRLFLNKGNLEFIDITKQSSAWGMKAWSTGVTMADVNSDGLLDIYVCNSGNANGDNRENELFINNGDLTFSERASEFGLADGGWSTHSVFFDYDLDGDLDCYVLNNSFRSVNSFDHTVNLRTTRHDKGGDRLYRNDDGSFMDVSEEAGIYGSEIAFGLGITVSDFDQDGWPDIYISNDFYERDYLYVNNGDGTFTESLEERFNHISEFSMGADAADLNNDGYPELYTTDMLPRTDHRLKTGTSFMTYDVQQVRKTVGFYNQYMRNSLQLNNQNGTFSEIGLFADVAATDWSWGAIIADFDLSGDKDIFVTNGIYHDVIDQDFLNGFQEDAQRIVGGAKVDYKKIVEKMPLLPLDNFMFVKNDCTLRYEDVAADWGLSGKSFSNGAAHGDLDLDGDLDLVVNNVNQPAQVYRNNAESQLGNSYLSIRFTGSDKNTMGLGAKVWIYRADSLKYYEHFPIRGFQSSMNYSATIGLGKWKYVDELKVVWPDGGSQSIMAPKVNSTIILNQIQASDGADDVIDTTPWLVEESGVIDHKHEENLFVDYNYDRLLLEMNSRQGPCIAKSDVNGDSREDLYIGGAMGQPGQLFLGSPGGTFRKTVVADFVADASFEDVDAVFFDIDSDGDDDLLVVSGGSERGRSVSYQDRVYINGGSGTFERSTSAISASENSGACVAVHDFDEDGDTDVFIGTRLEPNQFGIPVSSQLLENRDGKLIDVTKEKMPQAESLGMVTDATWSDIDGDDKHELLIVGQWMPVTVFKNRGAGFQKIGVGGLEHSSGLWNCIYAKDINEDGLDELFVGNLGLNSRFKASAEQPLKLYINDFDDNGTLDPIYTKYDEEGRLTPFTTKHNLTMQLPGLKKKFLKFSDYAGKSMIEVFGQDALNQSLQLQADLLTSMVYQNQGGSFKAVSLPQEVQFSTVNAVAFFDIDQDGNEEILVAGNNSSVQPELGQYDANYGIVLEMVEQGFKYVPYRRTGLKVRGDVRAIEVVDEVVVFARNDDHLAVYSLNDDER